MSLGFKNEPLGFKGGGRPQAREDREEEVVGSSRDFLLSFRITKLWDDPDFWPREPRFSTLWQDQHFLAGKAHEIIEMFGPSPTPIQPKSPTRRPE